MIIFNFNYKDFLVSYLKNKSKIWSLVYRIVSEDKVNSKNWLFMGFILIKFDWKVVRLEIWLEMFILFVIV